MARAFGCLVVGLVAFLAFGLASANAAPRCQASDLRVSAVPNTVIAEAGRDHIVIRLQNVSGGACLVDGHPRLALLRNGNSLPTRMRRLGGEERTIIKAQGTAVIQVGYRYHYRTAGKATRCRTSTNLLVALPGMEHFNVPARITACGDDPMPYAGLYVNTSDKGYITLSTGNLGFLNSGTGNVGFGNVGDSNLGFGNTGDNNLGSP